MTTSGFGAADRRPIHVREGDRVHHPRGLAVGARISLDLAGDRPFAGLDLREGRLLEVPRAGVPAPEPVAADRAALDLDCQDAVLGMDDDEIDLTVASGPTGTDAADPADVRVEAGMGGQVPRPGPPRSFRGRAVRRDSSPRRRRLP